MLSTSRLRDIRGFFGRCAQRYNLPARIKIADCFKRSALSLAGARHYLASYAVTSAIQAQKKTGCRGVCPKVSKFRVRQLYSLLLFFCGVWPLFSLFCKGRVAVVAAVTLRNREKLPTSTYLACALFFVFRLAHGKRDCHKKSNTFALFCSYQLSILFTIRATTAPKAAKTMRHIMVFISSRRRCISSR